MEGGANNAQNLTREIAAIAICEIGVQDIANPMVQPKGRAFLNQWFAKPMVCVRVAFHENDGNHENDETTKTTQTATNKELSAAFADITETTEMTKTTRIQGANHGFPKPRV